MKRRMILFLAMLMLAVVLPAAGQQIIGISGAVRNLQSDPVPFHPVFMTSNDSLLSKTFITDETGFFRDSLVATGTYISYLYFFTYDFQNNYYDTVVQDLNSMVFVEFHISTDTVPVSCQAHFSYVLDSLSFEPNVYRFYDQSAGNLDSWYWDFGDGTFSVEQNPVHQYADSGEYLVCLTVASLNNPVQCTDTYCSGLLTPNYFNLGGLVFAGDYPLNNPVNQHDTAMVLLYRLVEGQLWFMGSQYFEENGYYWFASLLQGEYLIKVGLTENSGGYLNYIPTYYGDQVNWDAAAAIHLYGDMFENEVHLVPVAGLETGPGSIAGYITWEGAEPSGGFPQPSITLFDSGFQPVFFTWSDPAGEFAFHDLPYGQYFIRADIPGHPSEAYPVELSPETPNFTLVELVVNELAFFGVDEPHGETVGRARVYPNPAGDYITVELRGSKRAVAVITVTDISGRVCLTGAAALQDGPNKIRLDISGLGTGLYMLKATTPGQAIPAVAKFLK